MSAGTLPPSDIVDSESSPPTAPASPVVQTRVPRVTLPAFIFAHFAHHVGTGGLAPLLPLIRDSFGLDYARSGLLLSAQGLALGFGQLPISVLADRWSKRLMIAAGLIGVGLTGIGISLSTTFWQLIPLLIATGILAATYHAPTAAFLAGSFGAMARGRALGTHVIGGAVAFSLTPVIAIAVVQLTGSWRAAFLVLSIVPLIAGAMMLVITWRMPEHSTASTAQPKEQVKALSALKAIGPLVGVALAEQLLTASMFAYIPLFMVDHHQASRETAGLYIAIITGVGIFAAPLGGALSDRFGRAPVLVAATACVGPLILLLAHVPNGWPVVLVLVLYGLSMNTRLPVLESLFADAVPAHRRATVLGVYYFIGQESSGVITPLVGRLIDVTSPVQAFTILGIIGTLISLVLVFNRRMLMTPRVASSE